MSLLDQLASPELILGMSNADKISAGLLVTALGMGITFVVLTFLWIAIVVMSRLINGNPHKVEKPVVIQKKAAPVIPTSVVADSNEVDEELIAVITAAIAACLNTSQNNIIVKNITEFPTRQVAWSRAGVMEQIQSRY